MRSVLIICSLVAFGLACGGCAEFQSCGHEIAVQGGYLHDAVEFDVSYFAWLPGNSTRSDQEPWEIFLKTGRDMDQIWKDLMDKQRPEPPVTLAEPVVVPVGTYAMPSKRPVVAPPKEATTEKIEGSNVVIIRSPDGGVTVTNAPDKVDK